MKCVCTQENLSEGLSIVSHLASKNANLPILNNILLRAEKGSIQLLATNLETGITRHIRGKVEQEGSFTIPARVFSEYISLLGQENVTIEQEGNILHIRCAKTTTKLHGLPAEDFPVIPQVEKKDGYTCSAQELREAISQVIFAAAYDDARPEISGVLFRFAQKTLTLVATDSYRLAEKKITLSGGKNTEVSAIIPVRTLQELLRALSDGAEEVSVYLTENQILFSYQETELVSRLVDGQYPDYQQIIPTTHTTRLTALIKEFLQAAKATSLFSRPGINDVTLALDPKGKRVILEAANAQLGENKQEITAEIEGTENTIVFNSRYLLDGITNLGGDDLVFEMTNNASPGVLRPKKDSGYLYIIMPIKQ